MCVWWKNQAMDICVFARKICVTLPLHFSTRLTIYSHLYCWVSYSPKFLVGNPKYLQPKKNQQNFTLSRHEKITNFCHKKNILWARKQTHLKINNIQGIHFVQFKMILVRTKTTDKFLLLLFQIVSKRIFCTIFFFIIIILNISHDSTLKLFCLKYLLSHIEIITIFLLLLYLPSVSMFIFLVKAYFFHSTYGTLL